MNRKHIKRALAVLWPRLNGHDVPVRLEEQIAYVKSINPDDAMEEARAFARSGLGPIEQVVVSALIEHDAVMHPDLIDDEGNGVYWRWLEETGEDDFSYWDAAKIITKALRAAGYEVVKPVCDVAPQTVYIGVAYDKFETTLRKGHGKRVIVVERATSPRGVAEQEATDASDTLRPNKTQQETQP